MDQYPVGVPIYCKTFSDPGDGYLYPHQTFVFRQYQLLDAIYNILPHCITVLEVVQPLPKGINISKGGVITGMPLEPSDKVVAVLSALGVHQELFSTTLHFVIKPFLCPFSSRSFSVDVSNESNPNVIKIARYDPETDSFVIIQTVPAHVKHVSFCEKTPSVYRLTSNKFDSSYVNSTLRLLNREKTDVTYITISNNGIPVYRTAIDTTISATYKTYFSTFYLLPLHTDWDVFTKREETANYFDELSRCSSDEKCTRTRPTIWPIASDSLQTAMHSDVYTSTNLNNMIYKDVFKNKKALYLYKTIEIPEGSMEANSILFHAAISTNCRFIIYINGKIFSVHRKRSTLYSPQATYALLKSRNSLFILDGNPKYTFQPGTNTICIELYKINNSNSQTKHVLFSFHLSVFPASSFSTPNRPYPSLYPQYIQYYHHNDTLLMYNDYKDQYHFEPSYREPLLQFLYILYPFNQHLFTSYTVDSINIKSIIFEVFMNNHWKVIHFQQLELTDHFHSNNEVLYDIPLVIPFEALRITAYLIDRDYIYDFKMKFFNHWLKNDCMFNIGEDQFEIPFSNYIVAPCSQWYNGFTFYYCDSEHHTIYDRPETNQQYCSLARPQSIHYPVHDLNLTYQQPFTAIVPTVVGIVTAFIIEPELPLGITMDPHTGRIDGVPMDILPHPVVYQITGMNEAGTTEPFLLTISLFGCPQDGDWGIQRANSTAELECDSKYTGKRTRYCDINGSWSREVDNCVLRHCPREVVDGVVYPSTPLDTLYSSQCSGNFYGFTERYCNENAEWEQIRIACQVLTCNEQKSEGYVWPQTQSGQEYKYSCQKGYRGGIVRKCERGVWKQVVDQCVRIMCEEVLEDGYMWPATVADNDAVHSCSENEMGSVRRHCNSEGHWEETVSTCRRCAPGTMPLYVNNRVAGCRSCPPGKACLSGDRQSIVTCQGTMYSQGGERDCKLCVNGKTVGDKEGNILCKKCSRYESYYENRCVRLANCEAQGTWKRTVVGQYVYHKCSTKNGVNYQGYMYRQCIPRDDGTGTAYWGNVINNCCMSSLFVSFSRSLFCSYWLCPL